MEQKGFLTGIGESVKNAIEWVKKNALLFIFMVVLFASGTLSGITAISSTIKLDRARECNDRITERVIEAERLNKELEGTIERCQQLCSEYEQSISRNISSIKEATELIEETRYLVQCIEVELGLWNSDSIYDRFDAWLEFELNNKGEKIK